VVQKNVVDEFVLSNLHDSVFPALSGCTEIKEVKSLGVIESYSVASAIIAADTAVKASNVELIEVRLARGMGGKAMVTLTGDVGAVTAAIRAGSNAIQDSGFLVDQLVLPAPHSALHKVLF
jgi:microcompartment protein CcmL/EutN